MNKKVFIKQDDTIPPGRIIAELQRYGGLNIYNYDDWPVGYCYCIKNTTNEITVAENGESGLSDYTELLYNKETDSFYEKSQRMVSAEAKEALLPDVIKEGEYAIPEGYEAKIEDGKVVVTKKKWKLKEGELVYFPEMQSALYYFRVGVVAWYDGMIMDVYVFQSKEECRAFCDKLNNAIKPILEERRKEVK